jgi:hypothetical protein
MSEKEESPKAETSPKGKEGAKEKAKAALEQRSKKSSDAIYYWMVLGGFVVMCLACVFYVFKEWRTSPNLVPAISQADINSHNDMHGAPFRRGPNALFKVSYSASNFFARA